MVKRFKKRNRQHSVSIPKYFKVQQYCCEKLRYRNMLLFLLLLLLCVCVCARMCACARVCAYVCVRARACAVYMLQFIREKNCNFEYDRESVKYLSVTPRISTNKRNENSHGAM
jgi:hypothetical protein